MKVFYASITLILVLVLNLWMLPSAALATTYDLIAPSGTFTRGQNIQFIINIDTQGAPLSTTQIGMTYQKQYLEYVSIAPGDAMTTVTATASDASLLISGSNATPYNGAGVFAYVTFKIIAQAPGSAELCTLVPPDTTPAPTVAPTAPPNVQPTAPVPTALPETGTVGNTTMITIVGSMLLLSSLASFTYLQKSRSNPRRRTKH